MSGIAGATRVLAPRGAPKPVIGAIVAVSLVGGAGLAAVPDLRTADPSLVGATYTTRSGAGFGVPTAPCRAGSMPLNGGFVGGADRPRITSFHPTNERVWELGSSDGTGSVSAFVSTVCLTLHEDVPWKVRSAPSSIDPAAQIGSVDCEAGEIAVSGGWRLPWGHSGIVGSFPETAQRWTTRSGADTDRRLQGDSHALCVRFPSRVRVYHATGSATGGETAIARCKPGDGVLNGGGYAYPIAGSHPVDGGWAVEAHSGGAAAAFAICYKASRAFGLHASYTRSATGTSTVSASCDKGDSILAGGWTNGHGLDTFNAFLSDGDNWRLTVAASVGGAASSYALCAKPYES